MHGMWSDSLIQSTTKRLDSTTAFFRNRLFVFRHSQTPRNPIKLPHCKWHV